MEKLAEFDACAVKLKALADPSRLRLVKELLSGPSDVSGLCKLLGEEIVKVSHHLGVLKKAGIVQSKRNGKHIYYALAPDVAMKKQDQINLGCCRFDLTG